MALTINDDTMTGDQTPHTARLAPGRPSRWEVSWLPGQTLGRNTAITAMILADIAGEHDLHSGYRLWPHIQSWADELGLTGTDAITRISQPPPDHAPQDERAAGRIAPQEDRDSGQPAPEAAD